MEPARLDSLALAVALVSTALQESFLSAEDCAHPARLDSVPLVGQRPVSPVRQEKLVSLEDSVFHAALLDKRTPVSSLFVPRARLELSPALEMFPAPGVPTTSTRPRALRRASRMERLEVTCV